MNGLFISSDMHPYRRYGYKVSETIPYHITVPTDEDVNMTSLCEALNRRFVISEAYSDRQDQLRSFLSPSISESNGILPGRLPSNVNIPALVFDETPLLPRIAYDSEVKPPEGDSPEGDELDRWCSAYVDGMIH